MSFKEPKDCFLCKSLMNDRTRTKQYFDGKVFQEVHSMCMPKPTRKEKWYHENRRQPIIKS